MNVFIIVSLSLITISFMLLAYYAIITFIQVKKTAKMFEETLSKINTKIDSISRATSVVSFITSSISPVILYLVSILGSGFKVIKNFLSRGGKK